MKILGFVLAFTLIVGCSRQPVRQPLTKEHVLGEIMIPLAREFIERNKLPYGTNFSTNSVTRYRVNFLEDKPGCTSSMTLTNGCYFGIFWEGTNSEVRNYHDKTRTGYNLGHATKAEFEAVKALGLRNKLNDETALKLAKEYFKLLGHREQDFHPVQFGPETWGEKGEADFIQFPFYQATWYRKDANLDDRARGELLPNIMIEVSGISSNMVSYSKCFMPVGRDF